VLFAFMLVASCITFSLLATSVLLWGVWALLQAIAA